MLSKFSAALRRRARSTWALTALVLVCGLAAALAAGTALRVAERHTAEQAMDRRAALARTAVAAEAKRYTDAAQSIAASIGAQREMTAAEFAALTMPLRTLHLPGATEVGFVVPVAGRDVPLAQRHWRSLGATDLVLRPARSGDRGHAFAVFQRRLDGGPVSAGTDLAGQPEPAAALDRARSSAILAVSDTYRPVGEAGLPVAPHQLSFLLAAPVYAVAPDGEGTGAFRGWATLSLHAGEFLGTTLSEISQGELDAFLYAVTSTGRRVPVAALGTASTGAAEAPGKSRGPVGLTREATVRVAQQEWLLRVRTTRGLLPAGTGYLDAGAFAALAGLTLLLAALVYALGSSRSRAERRVAEATAALRAKQEYVTALVDTMDVILVAGDDTGRLTLVNRPALELHGYPAGSEPTEWAAAAMAHFYETDGVTPLPASRLPLQRTLAEGEVHDVEFVVAPPGLPRRWLSAHGRMLHAADGTSLGAVTAAYDITSLRESEAALRAAHQELAATNADLQRSNDELSAFAGLVSHDLKSPLAGIAGYLDLLRELTGEGGTPAETAPFLERIDVNVRRMRNLIEDLLAYATARNATPEAAPVDLRRLAEEVAAAHTDRVRLAGRRPVPTVLLGNLPTVQADPLMVRQLLDNLIGNALKYVPAGQPARVEVAAETERPGWARIVVADRGIGIPPGQHEAVFGSFHRAHRDGGYPGTGLGLAICQRIVDRHGGSIGAQDNPGGGTRIWFTLPKAPAPDPMVAPAPDPMVAPAPGAAATASAEILELSAANSLLSPRRPGADAVQ